ncbi:MAG: hypothetical protein EXS05_13445 [Planctomycetaceae bacterium]|nr:hypothetical protein [Planctomycetaceae bacterium]
MRRVWKSWDVRWAYEGVASLADHLGYPPEKVLSNEAEQDEFGPVCSLNPAKEKGWTDIVASILWSPGHLGLYPLAGYPVPYLAAGLPLLSVPEAKHGYRQIALGDWIDEFPTGGFHIDVPSKTIEFWTIDPRVDATRRLSAVWPGWTVIWRKDDYEFQSERTSGYLQFPLVNRQDLEQRIMDHFLTDRNYPFEPPREIRLQILAATLEPDVDSITPYDRR